MNSNSFPIIISIVLFRFLFPVEVISQTTEFEHISTPSGLSQKTVLSIFQDKQGYIWFGTAGGLNRFDGYGFTIFKNDKGNPYSISGNIITCIVQDCSGFLWIGTEENGLNRFNPADHKFTQYRHNKKDFYSICSDHIKSICEDRQGIIWIATDNGLSRYDKKKKNFINYYHNPTDINSLSQNDVNVVFIDDRNELWVGTNGKGIDKLNPINNVFTHFALLNCNKPLSCTSGMIINSIYQDSRKSFWISTEYGLFFWNRDNNKAMQLVNIKGDIYSLSHNSVKSVIEDNDGDLWIATGGGLNRLCRRKSKFTRYIHDPDDPNSLSNNSVLSVMTDRSGIIWCGTSEGGINKYDSRKTKFGIWRRNPYKNNCLSDNTIRSICEDRKGNIWIGTYFGGLNIYNPKNRIFSHLKHSDNIPNSLSNNTVTSIFEDTEGNIWVGTWGGGLNKIKSYSGARPVEKPNYSSYFYHYRHDPANSRSIGSDIIQDIYEDSSGDLWIGTNNGLDRYEKNNRGFIHYMHNPDDDKSLPDNAVQSKCIKEDKFGNIWIGTYCGLSVIVKEQKANKGNKINFINFFHKNGNTKSISSNKIISICTDSELDEYGNSIIWIGTYDGGLNKMTYNYSEISKAEFKSYTSSDGLSNDVIYGIQSDEHGGLWLSTENGLSRFDKHRETFRNYDESDGLQANQFYWGASYKTKNGELFFGGVNGLNYFYPDNLKDNLYIPPLVISEFSVLNKPVQIEGDPSRGEVSSKPKVISIPFTQNVLSFEFAALNFSNTFKNQYAYILEGFDKQWVYSGTRRYITYTNLPPGHYLLRVKAANNDGLWNEEGLSIAIIINPPVWMTWWFICISTILIAGIIIYFVSWRVKQILAIERLRLKIAADLHDNIGSSLTEISIMSELVLRTLDSGETEINKNLINISKNSRLLIDKMSDIVWLVNPKRDSLYDLIIRLKDNYSEILSYMEIDFRSENLSALKNISLPMDQRQQIYLLFKEAINNSIKYSHCTQITLNAFVNRHKLEMTLKDNGVGFDYENVKKGNGLDNMSERARKIKSSLTIFSEPGKGTIVHFCGPVL